MDTPAEGWAAHSTGSTPIIQSRKTTQAVSGPSSSSRPDSRAVPSFLLTHGPLPSLRHPQSKLKTHQQSRKPQLSLHGQHKETMPWPIPACCPKWLCSPVIEEPPTHVWLWLPGHPMCLKTEQRTPVTEETKAGGPQSPPEARFHGKGQYHPGPPCTPRRAPGFWLDWPSPRYCSHLRNEPIYRQSLSVSPSCSVTLTELQIKLKINHFKISCTNIFEILKLEMFPDRIEECALTMDRCCPLCGQ